MNLFNILFGIFALCEGIVPPITLYALILHIKYRTKGKIPTPLSFYLGIVLFVFGYTIFSSSAFKYGSIQYPFITASATALSFLGSIFILNFVTIVKNYLQTLTPHHLGNMFNPSFLSISSTFFGTSVMMLFSPISR